MKREWSLKHKNIQHSFTLCSRELGWKRWEENEKENDKDFEETYFYAVLSFLSKRLEKFEKKKIKRKSFER